MTDTSRGSNRLIGETSPYLLQHADNPVAWQPWDEKALAQARREDLPILLSIGYSACHWCHVMEHECFEDETVARTMNDNFVCIKLDREERPDLDHVYQLAHQLLTGRGGGWPLNVFLTPDDHVPFFAGTYFPREPRHGMPAFTTVLERVAAYYREHRDELGSSKQVIRDAFARIEPPAPADDFRAGTQLVTRACEQLARQYDPVHGGFGDAPKFPHPTNIELLLRNGAQLDGRALSMALHTLEAMARGGLYDQVGGGFARYCVDQRWEIPHFEKMLYDNAQLLPLYAEASRFSDDPLYARIARETGEWVIREMQGDAGGYYSTLDADSEGHEGRFYVWSTEALRAVLDEAQWQVVETCYGLRGQPNFEGHWHLNLRLTPARAAERLHRPEAEIAATLEAARRRLLEARDARVRPALDDKILTAWNGLMIRGMARAGHLLGRGDFIDSAQRAADFVRTGMWRDGRLLATARDGRAHLNAYLDDYACLAAGLLELLQARWRRQDLDDAIRLADAILEHFEDSERGGLYFTSHDHEQLLHRYRPTVDDSTPSGNGLAAQVLLRLGHLLGEHRYLDAAERIVRALADGVQRMPAAHGSMLIAIAELAEPPQTVVLRGEPEALGPWVEATLNRYDPSRMVVAVPASEEDLPGLLAERRAPAGTAAITAWVCEGHVCREPVSGLDAFEAALSAPQGTPP